MDKRERNLLKGMIQMIWADGEVDESERKILGEMLTHLGIADQDMAEVAEMMKSETQPDPEALRAELDDPDDRQEMMRVLLAAALADGVIQMAELKFLNKMADVLEITSEELGDLHREAAEAME